MKRHYVYPFGWENVMDEKINFQGIMKKQEIARSALNAQIMLNSLRDSAFAQLLNGKTIQMHLPQTLPFLKSSSVQLQQSFINEEDKPPRDPNVPIKRRNPQQTMAPPAEEQMALTITMPSQGLILRSRAVDRLEVADPVIANNNLSHYLDRDGNDIPTRNGWETIQRRYKSGPQTNQFLLWRARSLLLCAKMFAQDRVHQTYQISEELRLSAYYRILGRACSYNEKFAQDPFLGFRSRVSEFQEGYQQFLLSFSSEDEIDEAVRRYQQERNEGRFTFFERDLRSMIKFMWFADVKATKKALDDFEKIYAHQMRFTAKWRPLFYRNHPQFELKYAAQIDLMREILCQNMQEIQTFQRLRKRHRGEMFAAEMIDTTQRSFQNEKEEVPTFGFRSASRRIVRHHHYRTSRIVRKGDRLPLPCVAVPPSSIKKEQPKEKPKEKPLLSLEQRLKIFAITGQMTWKEGEQE